MGLGLLGRVAQIEVVSEISTELVPNRQSRQEARGGERAPGRPVVLERIQSHCSAIDFISLLRLLNS